MSPDAEGIARALLAAVVSGGTEPLVARSGRGHSVGLRPLTCAADDGLAGCSSPFDERRSVILTPEDGARDARVFVEPRSTESAWTIRSCGRKHNGTRENQ